MRWQSITLLLLLVGFASAITSDSTTNFTISGCGGDMFPDTCSSNGEHYCSPTSVEYDTLTDGWGCSYGVNLGYPTEYSGNACCPTGYSCTYADGETVLTCNQVFCSDYADETSCESNNCFWNGGSCVNGPDSCSDYSTNETCVNDIWDMNENGVDADNCGDYIEAGEYELYVKCICAWDGSECYLDEQYEEPITGTTSSSDSFKCEKSTLIGDCVDGYRTVDEIATGTNNGFDEAVYNTLLEKVGCTNSSYTQSCGTEAIKMSGFSILATILAILAIAAVYWRKH